MNTKKMIWAVALMLAVPMALASPASEQLLASYATEGASRFDAERGRNEWNKESTDKDGGKVSCITCHGSDMGKEGKHHKTGKIIKPMAPSVNAERFTDAKKIEKWFKRNCNDVRGRDCTAQEKGDFLKFLTSL